MKLLAIPLLVALYFVAIFPLAMRNLFQRVTWSLVEAFDTVAMLAGWDTALWPLPRASDSPLPFAEEST
jgi:hypothetical protein